ncbi:MAG: C25 family cysteine peptidase, partial [Desulfobacterales bacterium]|nr:C25 family cysteine peptidase [Desulfobacterales bacterium]
MRREIIAILAMAAVLAGAAFEGRAAVKIFSGSDIGNVTGQAVNGYAGQRKLVRDGDGYWYAVAGAYNTTTTKWEVVMKKSLDTAGTAWSAKVVLCGSGGVARDDAGNDQRFPAIDIDRRNGRLHLVFQHNGTDLMYSKCIDLQNWTDSLSWRGIKEVPPPSWSYETIATGTFTIASNLPHYGPTIAVDPEGNVHIAYSRSVSGTYRPRYLHGKTASGFAAEVAISAAAVNHKFPTVEVDSSGRVHYLVQYGDLAVHAYHSDSYTSFTGPTTLFSSPSNALFGISLAADGGGRVHAAVKENTDNDLWTAVYSDGAWSATPDMDTLGWGWQEVSARLGDYTAGHILFGSTDSAYPRRLYTWRWTGSEWGQPETDTGIDLDYAHSAEKNIPAWANDVGLTWFDDSCEGSNDCVWFERLPGLGRSALLAYSEAGASAGAVRYRSFGGANWGSEATAWSTGETGVLKWHTAAASADGARQAVVAVGSNRNTLYAALYDGAGWSTHDLGAIYTSDYRCFAAAYEQQSGRLLIVAGTATNDQIKYWVHDGDSWVVNGSTYTFTSNFSSTFNWLRMDARPDSNQVALIARPNVNHVGALIWDGEADSWGNEKKLSSVAVPANSQLCHIDVKYMRAGPYKGQAVFLWPSSSTLYSWTWTGSAWESSAKSKSSAAGGSILWLELAADPNSSKLLAALGDSNEYLYTVDWTGSSWGTARSVSADLLYTVWYGRRFAVSFESGSGHQGHAVIAYSDSANLKYRHTSDITGAWGAETSLDAGVDCNFVRMERDVEHTIHLVCQADGGAGADDLAAYSWNNTAWTAQGVLEADLQSDGNGSFEAFAIATRPVPSAAPSGLGPMIAVGVKPDARLRYSLWNGREFPEAAVGPAGGSQTDGLVVVESGPRGKMVVWGRGGILFASFFDGAVFGPVKSLPLTNAQTDYRGFDVALETGTGRFLIVAGSGADLKYWIYDGESWVVDGSTITGLSLGSSNKRFIELASDPLSNDIAMVALDSNNAAYGVIWNGAAGTWGDDQLLEASLASSSHLRPASVCYVAAGAGAGKAMFAWGAGSNLESRLYSRAGGWEAEIAPFAIGGAAAHVRLKADPNSNKLVFGALRPTTTSVVAVWNGSAWGNLRNVDTAMVFETYGCFDVIFERDPGHEGHILVAYSDTTRLRWRHATPNGTSYTWSSEASVGSITLHAWWAQLQYGEAGSILLATAEGSNTAIHTWNWNNTAFGAYKRVYGRVDSGSPVFFISPPYAPAAAGVSQTGYIWREDDGDESGASNTLAENSKLGVTKEATQRLRVSLKNGGDYATRSYQLQVAETASCAAGAYYPVGSYQGSGLHWSASGSAKVADGEPTTNYDRLSDPASFTFSPGRLRAGADASGTIYLDTSQFTELEFALQATAAATAGGDYCFRLFGADTFTVYAEARVNGVTAVRLLEFAARGEAGRMAVSWNTAQEVDNKGFDLFRAAGPAGPWVKLNAGGLIPSGSESGEGVAYRFVDEGAAPGAIYYYRLEDVDGTGTRTVHGPVCVDWDGDGLPDDWELAHGFDPGLDNAAADPDGDGVANWLEHARGSNPRQADGERSRPQERAGVAGSAEPGVAVLAQDEEGVVLELITPGFEAAEAAVGAERFERVGIPAYLHGYTPEPGRPQLPVKGVLVDLPAGCTAQLEILEAAGRRHAGYRVYPAPAAAAGEDGRLQERFAWEEAAYGIDAPHPAAAAELKGVYVHRGQVKQRVVFHPLRFNAATGELWHHERIRVRVRFALPAAQTHRAAAAAAEPWRPPAGEVYAVRTAAEGVYRISREWLSAQGLAAAEIDALELGGVQLFHRGQERPLEVWDANGNGRLEEEDFIGFYAPGLPEAERKYARHNAFFLVNARSGSPLRMGQVAGGPAGGPLAAGHRYRHHHEQDRGYLQKAPGADDSDRWFFLGAMLGPGFAGGGAERSYALELSGVQPGAGELIVRLYSPYDLDHRAAVRLNGEPLGQAQWQGPGFTEARFEAVEFREGLNTVAFACESAADKLYLDWLRAEYERGFAAAGDALFFTHAGGYRYAIGNLSGPGAELFDITEEAEPRRVVNGAVSGAGPYTLEVQPAGAAGERRYLALGAVGPPAGIAAAGGWEFMDAGQGADWILITSRAVGWREDGSQQAWVEELTGLRRDQGLRTQVAAVERIFDAFGHGLPTPHAIKAFIAHAVERWPAPAPRYVLLVGDATYDYKDNRGLGTVNQVPGYLIYTRHLGETVSDEWFVQVSGEDALADLAIGRLPANSAAEAAAMAGKIVAYERAASTKGWERRLVLAADDQAQPWEAVFEQMGEEAAARLPAGMAAPERFYLQEYFNDGLAAADLTRELLGAIDAGALVVGYAGHAGVNVWADERILDNRGGSFRSDADTLANAGRYPLVVGMTCLSGYFIYPRLGGFAGPEWLSLAEALLLPAERGAVAAILPTAMTEAEGQRVLSGGLFEGLFALDLRVLGEAVAYAKQQLLANGGSGYEETANTFLFFGDPATVLKVPLPRRPAGLAASAAGEGVQLSWSAALDADGAPAAGYHVYRRSAAEAL